MKVLKNVMLFAPTIGYWRGQYQLPEDGVVVSIDDEELPVGTRTATRVKLITDKYPLTPDGETSWLDRFRAVEAAQKRIVNRYSLPFPIRGVRIVPKLAGEQFLGEIFGRTYYSLEQEIAAARRNGQSVSRLQRDLETVQREDPEAVRNPHLAIFDTRKTADEPQSVAYELRRVGREFTADLPRVLPLIAKAVGEKQWGMIRDKIPSPEAMRRKFHMDLVPVEIADGNSRELTTADLGAHRAIVQATLQSKLDEAIETMTAEPRRQLAAALTDIKELIDRQGRVTAKSFGPIQAAIEKIRMFQFVADKPLLESLNSLEAEMARTRPAALAETGAIRTNFLEVIQTVTQTATAQARYVADAEQRGARIRPLDF